MLVCCVLFKHELVIITVWLNFTVLYKLSANEKGFTLAINDHLNFGVRYIDSINLNSHSFLFAFQQF